MPQRSAALLLPDTIDWRGVLGFGLAFSFVLLIAIATTLKRRRFWRFAAQRLSAIRGRDWPMVSASVEVVSVVPQTEPIRGYSVEIVAYLVTLTYFYRNPELQTGDYSRMFDNEEDAQAWAAAIKGKTVRIRVDPGDPSRSALLKEDLP